MNNIELIDIIAVAIALLYTIISHELAHGFVALLNGDDTAKNAGRLSLNPISHLDPIGTLSLIVFRFGWAKPVPVNPLKFRNIRTGMFTVSIAGVSVNLISAALAMFLLAYIPQDWALLRLIFMYITIYGIGFCVFNLLPLPPLDGSKLIMSFLPYNWIRWINEHQRAFYIILLALLVTGVISKLIGPIIERIYLGLASLFYSF